MRTNLRICLLFGCWTLSGCFSLSDNSLGLSIAERMHKRTIANNPDVIRIDYALLERRAGDSFFERTLWDKSVDEAFLEPSQRSALHSNGWRVGRVIGALPQELERLIRLERYCRERRTLLIPDGKAKTIDLTEELAKCRYGSLRAGQEDTLDLGPGCFALRIRARSTESERAAIEVTPVIRHGERQTWFLPTPEKNTWDFERKRPEKLHPESGWRTEVDSNTILLVGTRLEARFSLGGRSLMDFRGNKPKQRVLILRVVCPQKTTKDSLEGIPQPEWERAKNWVPPALQAVSESSHP